MWASLSKSENSTHMDLCHPILTKRTWHFFAKVKENKILEKNDFLRIILYFRFRYVQKISGILNSN